MVITPIKRVGFICALCLSFLLYAMSYEPFNTAEFAYIFAVPAILCARFAGLTNQVCKAYSRIWKIGTFVGSFLAWIFILVWLRHLYPPAGYAAVIALPLTVSCFIFPFFWLMPKMLPSLEEPMYKRIAKLCAIASLWVVLEWLRAHAFSGFPWLLLAHSQWARPAVIQTASIGGVWLVSFTLIFFNLAVAEYIYRLYKYQKIKVSSNYTEQPKFSRFCPEFYLGLVLALLSLWIYAFNLPRTENQEHAFRAGLVQTDFAGMVKWDNTLMIENVSTVRNLSAGVAKFGNADVVLLPEAATPLAIEVDENSKVKIASTDSEYGYTANMLYEDLSKKINKPILAGNTAYPANGPQNGAFAITPDKGIHPHYYAKKKLVPFGEYVPKWAKFIGKVVPIADMTSGETSKPLEIKIAGKDYKAGVMICYEDIFPHLAREAALNKADFLFVCTNDSWYGREAGAWQHAAHSAFQAVSTRLPLVRSSNNGLSAVFDQYGRMNPCTTIMDENGEVWTGKTKAQHSLDIRDEFGRSLDTQSLKPRRASPMLNKENSIYFRGVAYSDMIYYKNLPQGDTFYVRHGDWFAALCFFLTATSFIISGISKIRQKKA